MIDALPAKPRRTAHHRAAGYASSLVPALSRPVWTLELGVLVNSFGNGMVVPFTVIYLHDVRGFPLPLAGLVIAAYGGVSLVAALASGSAVDRLGARGTLAATLLLLALGYALMPTVRSPAQAFAFMALAGLGNGAMWPAQSSILAALAGRELRSSAYAVQRALGNLGVGLGAFAGGAFAVASQPRTFSELFLVDAGTFVAYLALVPLLRVAREGAGAHAGGGWLRVLRDRPFLGVIGLNVVYVVAGYAMLEVALPVFANDRAGVGEAAIGLVFLVNTVTIVLFQMPLARALQGRSRMRALTGMTILWALAWVIVSAAAGSVSPGAAGVLFAFAAAVVAVGECALGPAQSALVADLAPPELRGRYIALLTASTAAGFFVGPAAVGWLVAAAPRASWLVAAALLLAAGGGAALLESRLPADVRVTPRPGARQAA